MAWEDFVSLSLSEADPWPCPRLKASPFCVHHTWPYPRTMEKLHFIIS